MARINTLSDFQSPQVRSVKNRYCPGMRSLWSFNAASYNPVGRISTTDLARRICMITTLGARTLIQLRSLHEKFVSANLLEFIIELILSLMGFFFIAYCLAVIGEVDDGERTVLGYDVVSLGLQGRKIDLRGSCLMAEMY